MSESESAEQQRRALDLQDDTVHAHILELSTVNEYAAAQLAGRARMKRAHYQSLLRHALRHANAHSIDWWLAALVPRLGVRSVLSLLRREVELAPAGVEKALYFLPRYVTASEEHTASLAALRAAVPSR